MSAPHVPGPHSVVRIKTDEGRHFLVVAPNGCPLAKLEHCAEDECNATLFAAAPDLLDALRALLHNVVHGNGASAWQDSKDKAAAAIAKATTHAT